MSNQEPTLKHLFAVEQGPGGTSPEASGSGSRPGVPVGDSVGVALENAKIEPSALTSAVRDSLVPLLDVRFSTVIVGAWTKSRLLRQYREKSREAPQDVFLLSLAKHAIRTKFKPAIELLINEKPVESLPLEIGVQLELQGLVLKIQNGRVLELRPGQCEASGTITCRDYPIAERKSQRFQLPGVLAIDEEIVCDGPADTVEAPDAAAG
ncbi:MAG: hypothetical protein AB7O32_10115 [Vicinamibacterales bacterium]